MDPAVGSSLQRKPLTSLAGDDVQAPHVTLQQATINSRQAPTSAPSNSATAAALPAAVGPARTAGAGSTYTAWGVEQAAQAKAPVVPYASPAGLAAAAAALGQSLAEVTLLNPSPTPTASPLNPLTMSTLSAPYSPRTAGGVMQDVAAELLSPRRTNSDVFEFDDSRAYRTVHSHPLQHVPSELLDDDEGMDDGAAGRDAPRAEDSLNDGLESVPSSTVTTSMAVAGSPRPYCRHSVVITGPTMVPSPFDNGSELADRHWLLSRAVQSAVENSQQTNCQAEVSGIMITCETTLVSFTLESPSVMSAGTFLDLVLDSLQSALRQAKTGGGSCALAAQLLSSYDMLQMWRDSSGTVGHRVWPAGTTLPGPRALGLLRVDSAHSIASAQHAAAGLNGSRPPSGDNDGPWAVLTLAVDGECGPGVEVLAQHEHRRWLRTAHRVHCDSKRNIVTVVLPLNDLLAPGCVRLIARQASAQQQLYVYSAHLDIESSDACRGHLKEAIVAAGMAAATPPARANGSGDILMGREAIAAETMLSALPVHTRPEFDVQNLLGKPPGHPTIYEAFIIGDQLGRGGYATVCRGTNRITGEVVAIKTLPKAKLRCKEDVLEVQNEVAILNLLAGLPYVVKLKSTHEDSEAVHIVMELCAGGELLDAILEDGSLTELKAAHYFRKMLEVVNACHEMGVFHRDLKLENFLLTSRGPDGDLRLADFGLGVFFKPSDRFHELVGTPYYVAPEVVREDYGHEADMWSLGVILYTLLSGLPPFYGGTDLQIFKKILRGRLELEGPMWIGVSDAAKDIIRALIKRDPAQRLTPARALEHPWLQQQGASDVPLDSVVLQRLRKFAQMNKLKKMFMMVVGMNLSPDDIAGLRELFKSMDADSNGTITVSEMRNALAAWGHKIDEGRLRNIMEMADVDGDGLINYNEFVAATMHESKLDKEELLLRSFRQLDRDESGKISVSEVSEAFSQLGMAVEDAAALLETADSNKDGQIDYDEYLSLMRDTASPRVKAAANESMDGTLAMLAVQSNAARRSTDQ